MQYLQLVALTEESFRPLGVIADTPPSKLACMLSVYGSPRPITSRGVFRAMRYVIPLTFAVTCALTALLGVEPSLPAPTAAVRPELAQRIGKLEAASLEGDFREVLALAGELRDELRRGLPDSKTLLARLEVQVATANLALGDLAGATQALQQALEWDPQLKLDPATAPRKLSKLLAGMRSGWDVDARPEPATGAVAAQAPDTVPAPAARPRTAPAQLAAAVSPSLPPSPLSASEDAEAAARWRAMPDSKGWWSALTGQPCRINFEDLARLTVREGRLDDGQRVNWSEFGDASTVAVLARADQPIVTPLAFGFHESGGPPAAVFIRFEARGEVRRGVLPLKVGGRYLELARTAEAPGVLRGRNTSNR
jgi:hypothetical protein